MLTFEWMLKGPVVILLLPHSGKSYTGEGSGRFEKLEKPAETKGKTALQV